MSGFDLLLGGDVARIAGVIAKEIGGSSAKASAIHVPKRGKTVAEHFEITIELGNYADGDKGDGEIKITLPIASAEVFTRQMASLADDANDHRRGAVGEKRQEHPDSYAVSEAAE